jgi:hypothetical protein
MLASVTATAAVEAHCVWVYRLIRAFLALGVEATLFFASVGVLSVMAAWWNVDGLYPLSPRDGDQLSLAMHSMS